MVKILAIYVVLKLLLKLREMLTDALRAMVNNLFKKSFFEEKKKNN